MTQHHRENPQRITIVTKTTNDIHSDCVVLPLHLKKVFMYTQFPEDAVGGVAREKETLFNFQNNEMRIEAV